MKPFALLFMGGALLLSSCGGNSGKVVTLESGTKYTLFEDGKGKKISEGEFFAIESELRDSNDSVWQEKSPMPGIFKMDSIMLAQAGDNPVVQVITKLSEGDSAVVEVADSLVIPTPYQARYPQLANISHFNNHLKVIGHFKSEEEVRQYQEGLMADLKKQEEEEAKALVAKDAEEIEAYLKENGIEAEKTESGLYYVITEKGDGTQAAAGDKVRVNYAGRTLKGVWFDTSIESVAKEQDLYMEGRPYGPFEFTLGRGMVIKGWDEGIALLPAGSKATLFIPSAMAYGPRAMGDKIAANSILIFDVELVEVEKPENM
ncbi:MULTISPECIES: FKBP-type peptidyl-prolyl cis-trans isomerase [Persicobacter]|nr:FKBP-type peptidyl-prolyl cis-trans isomerase [Persicobacter sp. CCB-QB2]